MKLPIFELKVFGLFAVMIVCLSAFAVKETDDRSFLDVHKNSLWKFGEPENGLTIYARINKSESEPLEIWLYDVIEDCYSYDNISDTGLPEVIENNRNRVQIKVGDDGKEHGIFTMTINGNRLNVELDSYENGKHVKKEEFELQRSRDDIQKLKVCQ